jgi:hypothetical protein
LFQADREHIHHNLLDLGLSHRKAVLSLYVVALIFCAASYALVALRDPTLALLVAVAAASATVIVKLLAVRRRSYAPPRVVLTLASEADPGTPAPQAPVAGPSAVSPAKASGGGEC